MNATQLPSYIYRLDAPHLGPRMGRPQVAPVPIPDPFAGLEYFSSFELFLS
jgi:hypothetical protein